jgi:hypothetical protein
VSRSIRATVAASERSVIGLIGSSGEAAFAMRESVRAERARQVGLVTIFDARSENFCDGAGATASGTSGLSATLATSRLSSYLELGHELVLGQARARQGDAAAHCGYAGAAGMNKRDIG